MSDDSIATQVEDWIVAQLRAMEFDSVAVFGDDENVQPWEGTDAESVTQFAKEIHQGKRDRVARVFFAGDRVERLSEDQSKVIPTYTILIGLRHARPAVSRRGDGTDPNRTLGTNGLRDILHATFDSKLPNVGSADGLRHTDRAEYGGMSIVRHTGVVCVIEATVTVDEVPNRT